jgi:crossover junction endodeoxyribonuclease RusA
VKSTGVNLKAILEAQAYQPYPKAHGADGLSLHLPYPPSVNSYYRNLGTKVLISAKGRQYRKAVANAIILGNGKAMAHCRYAVTVTLHRKDKRIFDIDNCAKAILDSLTHAGVWEDDSLVDDLRLIRGSVKKPGGCVVEISVIQGRPTE